jgi:hypothetical protein
MATMEGYDQLAGEARSEQSVAYRKRANRAKACVLEHGVVWMLATQRRSSSVSIVEIGCGQGGDLWKWDGMFSHSRSSVKVDVHADRGEELPLLEWRGMDISARSVEEVESRSRLLSRSRWRSVEARQGSMNSRWVVDGPADILSCMMAYHYAEDLDLWWGEAARVVRNHGSVVLTFFDGEYARASGVTQWAEEGASLQWRNEQRSQYCFDMTGSVAEGTVEQVVCVRATVAVARRHGFDCVVSLPLSEWLEMHGEVFGGADDGCHGDGPSSLLSHYRGMVFVKRA